MHSQFTISPRFFNLLALSLSLVMAVSARPSEVAQIPDVATWGNNTLFTKWRPTYHFMAPAGWMNDPTGAMYDPTRNEYHLFYQWHPLHVQWGNMTLGHAVSSDFITWRDVHDWRGYSAAAISPSEPYDKLGIFSGSAQPVNLKGEQDGTLLVAYTSISALPTNWKLPYIRHTESQSLAFSKDGGKSWVKHKGNPVIKNPPEGWNITGWRDPYFLANKDLDEVLGYKEEHFYLILGSGIKGVGSRIPLYTAKKSDLTKWEFLGALWEPKGGEIFGGDAKKTGSMGYNFEVPTFFSIKDEGEKKGEEQTRWFVTTGSEGTSVEGRTNWVLWNEGVLKPRYHSESKNQSVEFEIVSSGVGDWGNLYACTNFLDTKDKRNRRIQWGWSNEDVNQNFTKQMGYQGSLGLPRELFIKKYDAVLNKPDGYLTKKGSFRAKQLSGKPDIFSASTAGVRPLPEVVSALKKSALAKYNIGSKSYAHKSSGPCTINILESGYKPIASDKFILSARLSHYSNAKELGFAIRMSPDHSEQTLISFSPSTSRISVNRKNSTLLTGMTTATHWGYFQPLTLSSGSLETLDISIFVDNSLVEIFINDRFALTTRIYPWKDESKLIGLFVEDGEAKFEDVEIWTGVGGNAGKGNLVWPERPKNSSSELVWDGPEKSGNFTYWPGW